VSKKEKIVNTIQKRKDDRKMDLDKIHKKIFKPENIPK